MWVEKSRTKSLERKTFIKGKFKGKFIGTLDVINSDLIHEYFYDIEILEAEIFLNKDEIRHYNEGEHDEFINVMPFITSLPYYLKCNLNDNDVKKHYKIHLNDPKIRFLKEKDSLIEKVLIEGERAFGDLVGEISGYILHYDTLISYFNVWVEEGDEIEPSELKCIPTNIRTGKEEKSGNYIRYEYHCQCFKKVYWGNWVQIPEKEPFPWWVLGLIFWILVFLPLVIQGLKFILPIILFGIVVFFIGLFIRFIIVISRLLIYIFSFSYLLFFLFGIFSAFNATKLSPTPKPFYPKDSIVIKKDPITHDTIIISHYRKWSDYKHNLYSGALSVYVNEINSSNYFRNFKINNSNNNDEYNQILSKLYMDHNGKLQLLYPMFDSLKKDKNLNDIAFAEAIVSCIQDIPYTLILQDGCNPNLYNDPFIRDYLLNNKGDCLGDIKYGILSPSEFLEQLKGDCDTRTLMLFTILSHYKYDVAILSSELYRHSILAINLPLSGIYKQINGKKYVVWETTTKGFPPGIIPAQISNMRNWEPSLLNK
jgi:hypothetical protein